MAHRERLRAQMVRLFLVFTCIWQEDDAKFPKVPGASRIVNPARAITGLVNRRNHLLCHFSPPRQFLREKILFEKKNLDREMLI